MSRGMLMLGLLISATLHVCLLACVPGNVAPAPPPPPPVPTVIPVVDVPPPEPADRTPPPPEPTPAPAPEEPETPAPRPEPPAPPPAPPPPSPATLVQATETAHNDEPARGDLAGEAEGRPAPALRIDWGSESDAIATVRRGGMKIVVLEDTSGAPVIAGELRRRDGTWRMDRFRAGGRFSNRLRIVDDVPAFAAMRTTAQVRRPRHLAVLVPTSVEQTLESAQREAAFRAGLTLEQIRDVAGRFTLEEGGLGFRVTHLGHP